MTSNTNLIEHSFVFFAWLVFYVEVDHSIEYGYVRVYAMKHNRGE